MNDFLTYLFPNKYDYIYDILSNKRPYLCLDVGAAAGLCSRKIKESSDHTRIIAFEPFEGNHNYFYKNTDGLSDIQLIKKAVSNQVSSQKFYVHSVVKGHEQGWETMPGYSSIGFLFNETQENIFANIKRSIENILK